MDPVLHKGNQPYSSRFALFTNTYIAKHLFTFVVLHSDRVRNTNHESVKTPGPCPISIESLHQ